jgi:hypothetical protein
MNKILKLLTISVLVSLFFKYTFVVDWGFLKALLMSFPIFLVAIALDSIISKFAPK